MSIGRLIFAVATATPVAALIIVMGLGQDDPEGALRTLEADGRFTNIEIGEKDTFGCLKGEFYRTKFTATNLRGADVSGTVCRPFLDGASSAIRLH